ncbi:S1C family serine protease [Methanohalophilus sp.]|uniref:S1C family serine protease n=1 Tax=Methanohalophilus sp. TaxID=1966352 RepID=UPI00261C3F5C|nr:S1C family serine protease [Methanohalophilus sp.]MDK2892304.1 hypothetical protein [Methanohalophilus sp.]
MGDEHTNYATVFAILIIGFVIGMTFTAMLYSGKQVDVNSGNGLESSINFNTSSVEIYEKLYAEAKDSVVSVRAKGKINGVEFTTGGSGFLYDDSGHIVTNQHVIEDADTVEVYFING